MTFRPFPFLDHSCRQPFLDEPEHPPIGDSVFQELHHPAMVDGIEVAADVRIEEPTDLL
jgi:hypothetical protein